MKRLVRMGLWAAACTGLVACSVPGLDTVRQGVKGQATGTAQEESRQGSLSGTVSLLGVGAAAGMEVKVYAAEAGPQLPHWTTVTDAAGRYELTLPEGSYNVLVRKPGSNLAAARFGVQANTVVDIDLVPTGEIRGKVVTKPGVDMLGTDVFVPGTDLAARTDSTGAFVLGSVPFGSYTLVARRPAERILPKAVLDQGVSPLVTVGAGEMKPETEIGLIWDGQVPLVPGNPGAFADEAFTVSFAAHPAASVYRLSVISEEGQVLGEATGSASPLALEGLPAGAHWYQLGYARADGVAGSWAMAKPRQMQVVPISGPEFASIDSGTFVMGDANEWPNATQSVTLTRGFFMQKTHVTQEQWQALIGSNPSRFQGCGDCPVEQVSWLDAIGFANALSRLKGLPEVYNADGTLKAGADIYATTGYRLPTEAEWEYACRAGTTTRWYNGDDESKVGEIAWFRGNSNGRTQPVAQKQPNAFGLYDMAGNVWQWTSDWYANYPGGALTDPAGPESGSARVIRGGSWGSDASFARAAVRSSSSSDSDYRLVSIGFRLARSRP